MRTLVDLAVVPKTAPPRGRADFLLLVRTETRVPYFFCSVFLLPKMAIEGKVDGQSTGPLTPPYRAGVRVPYKISIQLPEVRALGKREKSEKVPIHIHHYPCVRMK